MPAWLINLIVSLAIKVGVPWVVKVFPKIPAEVLDIINTLIAALKEAEPHEKADLKKEARVQVKECLGIGCPIDTKK